MRENLEIINNSGEHLLDLINDILEMSKIEAGRITLNQEHFDIYELINNIERMFEVPCQQKRLQFSVDYDDDLPQFLYADNGKINQIITNLIGNAIKFTDDGGIILRIRTSPINESECVRLIIEVEDSGHGIDRKDADKVFGSFEQTESGIKSGQGTGLGLSICRGYANMMGGDVTYKSEVNQGSVFTAELQCQISDDSNIHVKPKPKQVISLCDDSPRYRILIADDNATNRGLLQQLLEPIGFKVKEASNGEEAVELFRSWHPDLILMDARMPVMTGSQATAMIRADESDGKIPIIAVSASAFEEDREMILEKGANEFIRKPFKKQLVLDKIGQLLNIHYFYGDNIPTSTAQLTQSTSSQAELIHSLQTLPQETLSALKQALTLGDKSSLKILVREIATQYAGDNSDEQENRQLLVETLETHLNNYDYDSIADLLNQSVTSHQH